MAELATIARPYAEALFKAVGAESGQTLSWLEPLAAIAADPRLRALADDPKASADSVFAVVSGVAQQAGGTQWGAIPANFLRTVIDNGRLSALPEIAEQFRALQNARSGSADAVVYSAFPMDANALAELGQTLQKRFARTLNLSVQVDPELIGGVRVVVDDEVLDTSVKARLEQMKTALMA